MVGKGKEHVLHKKFVVRMWGRGSHTVCVRNLLLEGGEGERTRERQKGKKSKSCNYDFQRVFSLEGLDLGFKLELNLEDAGWWN